MKPCILPWVNFGTNPFGRVRACGYSQNKSDVKLKDSSIEEEWNSEYFKEMRRDFLAGKWPSNCSKCEYVESMGGKSKKIYENQYVYPLYEKLITLTDTDGSVPYYPPHIDMRVGTICNLKCIHCGTGASSKWQEDKDMLDKYSNTEKYTVDNKWIEQDSYIWDSILENIDKTERLRFLGGEPFANKQHNKFIDKISESEYSKNITLFYVTNLTLLTRDMLEKLANFKMVQMQVSVDAPRAAGEYFRFPMKWDHYVSQLEMLREYSAYGNFLIKFQWTCSNVSMFYLSETYDLTAKRYNFAFDFCDFVEWPVHMSAQNLPIEIKKEIKSRLRRHDFGSNYENVEFYTKHMMERDLWPEHGKTLINYLDDLDASRKISWRESFKEMGLDRYAS